MKIAHWTAFNKSGMNRVAETMVQQERLLGLDSHCCNMHEVPTDKFESVLDADVHVSHTHFPNEVQRRITRPFKLIWVAHGTPEHTFHTSVEDGLPERYGTGDPWML